MLDFQDVHKAEGHSLIKDPYINTHSGRRFRYKRPSFNTIDIGDIAHALSHLCRFNGHTNSFWSVAQHSLLVADKIPGGPEEKLVGLLHDAAEAYTNDLPSPLKSFLREQASKVGTTDAYGDLQDRITAAIYRRFGVKYIPDNVRTYDRAACLFEAQGFMGLSAERLSGGGFAMQLAHLWEPWNPQFFAVENRYRNCWDIKVKFLNRFKELMMACGRGELL
ncbi:hypothetical protein LCGC14_0549270 [marine sediment metagenome]|uniref:HD domain-containing protein n=1 Tax=marine sediment metagenome TaxID=412755 RepID=A0A0F9UYP7_9ZZZZ